MSRSLGRNPFLKNRWRNALIPFFQKNLKKFKKGLDNPLKMCYNITTVREGKPNKPERI
jgi:hypothetical protein